MVIDRREVKRKYQLPQISSRSLRQGQQSHHFSFQLSNLIILSNYQTPRLILFFTLFIWIEQIEFQNITYDLTLNYNFRLQFLHQTMSITDNNPLKSQADDYLRKHRIVELFEDLCSDLCYEQPQNINEFLIERLRLKQKQGFKTGIFSKQQIINIFMLFDLKREGFIDKDRCKQALKTLANNSYQFEQVDLASLPDKIDEKGFVSLCEKVLGIK